jgi:16S rRNA (uracil1498-N3)-methyltransferase
MKPELRVPVENLCVGELALPEEAARYVVKVHRLGVGDRVHLFDPVNGTEAFGVVNTARLPTVSISVEEEPRQAPRRNMPVTLIQAVAKADKPEQAVRDATAFGVERVAFAETARSISRGGFDGKMGRLGRVAAQVARQCGRPDLPVLQMPEPLEETLRGSLLRPHRIVCGLSEGSVPLLEAVKGEQLREGVTLLVGPEGGFSPEEMRLAAAAGFRAVSLGPFVLRSETACTAALAALRALHLVSQ